MSSRADLTGLDSFLDAVRLNCHISDARHAREMTMCNYLLEMRELYRWERGVPYGIQPPRSEVGAWLAERETRWEELENADYAILSHEDSSYGPFEIHTINAWLNRQDLCYGAGIGRFGKPHFFVGEVYLHEQREGLNLLVCDREYARDLSTVPAALQGESIIVRRESVRRYLWERIEYWGTRDRSRAMQSVFEHYDIDRDRIAGVNRMLDEETESLVLHELGEYRVGMQLGSAWQDMLAACNSKRAEVVIRAVRDLWADSVSTLPTLLNRDSVTSLHLWFANFSGMRLALFPALMSAYQTWESTGDLAELRYLVQTSADHWRETSLQVMSRFQEKKELAFEEIERIGAL
jgi:hypothetical protein